MSVIVVGLSRRTVPLDLLERTAIPRASLPKALADLRSRDFLTEAVILSTCHRTEVYAVAERFHGAVTEIRRFLCEWSDIAPDELSDHLYTFHDATVAAHLFGVASGLDSVVVGESQILGQVRDAWAVARAEEAAGPACAVLFRHALEVGKRVRSETAIARGITSLAQAAVAMAADHLGSLEGRRVVVVGAGEMGEVMLAGLGPSVAVTVASRRRDRAEALARRAGGDVVDLAHLPDALVEADVVLTSISSPGALVDLDDFRAALARRKGRSLLVVDLGMPRNVDPAVGRLDGVRLLDLDAIGAFVASGVDARRAEVPRAREEVAAQVEAYAAAVTARAVAPTVGALHDRAEAFRQAELARHRARLAGLDPHHRRAVESLTRGIIGKLLHTPSVRLRDAAGSPRGDRLAGALVELFDLEVETGTEPDRPGG